MQCYIPGHALVMNYSFKHAAYAIIHCVYYIYNIIKYNLCIYLISIIHFVHKRVNVHRFISYKYILSIST